MFTEKFDSYVCEGDKIKCEIDGFAATATVYYDDDNSPPWERDEGHGPVSDWTSRDILLGERILSADRYSHRYYDFAEAVKIAKRDGWDTKPYGTGTKDEQAVRAAERDFEVLKAWCDDQWHYVGVAVTVSRKGVTLTHKWNHALWGIEGNYPDSNNEYLTEVANELLDDALDDARKTMAKLIADYYTAPDDVALSAKDAAAIQEDRMVDDRAGQ